ncbi:hypothetical protein [Caulobacter sp. DWP3-1-3b2]|uniref:hypothetical protein n=1 Tax=Caulobacter sp. DWP3-1-3b2 TaxID=2804643 RepID=UPI003CF2F9E3
MGEASAGIERTVRAGLAGWAPALRSCWAALVAGAGLALASRFLPLSLSALTPMIIFAAIVLGSSAVYRVLLAGPGGWHGLRWGREEWRLSAVFLLSLVILAVVGAVLLVIIGAVAVGVARSNAPGFDNGSLDAWRAALSGPGAIPASLPPLLSAILLAWLFLRLSLAPAATIETGAVQVLSAFGRTRGAVPRLAAAGLALMAPAAILVIPLTRVLPAGPIPDLIELLVLFFYVIPVWTVALVDVYRHQAAPATTLGTLAP